MSERSDEVEFKFCCPLCSYNNKKIDMEWRRKGKIIKGHDQQAVINVYNYFKKQSSDKSDNYIVKETCNATCISRVSFYRIKKAMQGPLRTQKKDREVTYRTSRYINYNDFVCSAIRRKVHLFFLQNIPPTLSAMLEKVNDDEELPNFKRTTIC
jgi:hypothetical protein